MEVHAMRKDVLYRIVKITIGPVIYVTNILVIQLAPSVNTDGAQNILVWMVVGNVSVSAHVILVHLKSTMPCLFPFKIQCGEC